MGAYTSTNIGRLRRRVTIQQLTTQPSEIDGTAGTWSTLATVWADVRAIRGTEVNTAGQMVPLLIYQVKVRYRNDVTPGMRIVLRSNKTLNIKSVSNEDELDIWMVLDCTELVAV